MKFVTNIMFIINFTQRLFQAFNIYMIKLEVGYFYSVQQYN